jgi:predicted ABC-type transport system involved in lysophospholipase L1 biosynthesis ATPase subunit
MDALLSLEGVSLHYQRGHRHVVEVLAGVSLDVWAGEVVCVWAQRGRGKTTLLRVAAGLEEPLEGRVSIEGTDLWSLSDRWRSQLLSGAVGWVEHGAPALDVPVLEHVAIPLKVARGTRKARRAYSRAREVLERVGAGDCVEQCWASLSDAERALVALARAVVREPRLLVVDDLTTMLRGREADEVARLLAKLAGERELGVLASVSSLEETTWSERMATLSGGKLLVPPSDPHSRRSTVVNFPGAGQPERENTGAA